MCPVAHYNSDIVISKNTITGNAAGRKGGGILCDNGPSITNNVISGNAASSGGGVYCDHSSPNITNTILWSNYAPNGPEIYDDYGGPYVTYCAVKGGWPGTGNIDAAPIWADPINGDFHLNWDSPCKDAGDPDVSGLPTTDAEGDPRIAGAGVDMGADEFYPHLYSRGDVVPGQSVTFHVVGEPGQSVKVALGAGVLDPPYPTPYGNLFIWPIIASWPIGTVPGSGIRILPATVPTGWNSGEEYPFQAQVGIWGNPDTLLSNLLTLTVE